VHVALDGTKVRANASKHKAMSTPFEVRRIVSSAPMTRRRAVSMTDSNVSIEICAPLGTEAVVSLPGDDAGAQRLLGAVIGGRNGAIAEEDEEISPAGLMASRSLLPAP
jgi:hypothetical protein